MGPRRDERSDSELLAAVRDRDRGALSELYRRHESWLTLVSRIAAMTGAPSRRRCRTRSSRSGTWRDATTVPELDGLDRFVARKKAAELLAERGLLAKEEPHESTVGFSERAGVPIEPRLSEQWFLKYPRVAGSAALRSAREARFSFRPERWETVYQHWLENIQDWCISRQLWWGHRIPVWYRKQKPKLRQSIHVGIEPPSDPENWEQDPDVLDTWFSAGSGRSPRWMAEATTRAKFYPTTDLVTGPDIIFFWVARMIMAGLEYMGEMPFRNVYFTGIIRDKQGRKMSKSLGNSPDPLDSSRNTAPTRCVSA